MYAAANMMIAICARNSLSMEKPSGRNSGNITDDMNSRLISGTPRMSSMYTTHSALIAGIFERRPRASSTPIGKAKAMPNVDRISVSGRPPQRAFST
ncbi:hypothetical protein LMG3458_04967 [Achromobacter deleyi]|uniref:Uncharacterized protein n=1 Tax=Achromobacter deleyi TaxID=1353891 RepID=A0A6S7BIH0_9BURK|nr:hypothetical protein LMG3458_04967 [Achromobacter deleyi]CAB3890818.1 hypothetical protein LMG3481_03759 [Achromobacter deleyi]CAB3918355.1 hypothetical protein LMG3482_05233 [Achromobacter deleyi]